MTVKRPVDLFNGSDFFMQELPVFINRVVETYDITEHRHDFLEICYVDEGSGTHHLGERALPVIRGDVFLIPVGVSHVFRPSSTAGKQPLIVYNCIISIDAASGLLDGIPGGKELEPLLRQTEYRKCRDHYGEIHRIFQALHHEYAARRAGREAALYQGVLALFLFLHRYDSVTGSEAPEGPDRMNLVIQTLHGRYDHDLSSREMARLAGVGERQLHRLFTKRTGTSLKDYLQNVRIHEACRLLRTSSRKVNDIASAVGYQNTPYFNELFKKKTGVSPREYRLLSVEP